MRKKTRRTPLHTYNIYRDIYREITHSKVAKEPRNNETGNPTQTSRDKNEGRRRKISHMRCETAQVTLIEKHKSESKRRVTSISQMLIRLSIDADHTVVPDQSKSSIPPVCPSSVRRHLVALSCVSQILICLSSDPLQTLVATGRIERTPPLCDENVRKQTRRCPTH